MAQQRLEIFVFGSNLAGRHGKGAAWTAKQAFGAIQGQGYGLQGQSFAIPTKDENLKTLPLWKISNYVHSFMDFARAHPEMIFNLTSIGCGLAGYKHNQVGPMFKDAPFNIIVPDVFIATW